MPDWFYRTVSQRVLFALSPQRARDFAQGMVGGLSRLPGGKYVIDLLAFLVHDRNTLAGLMATAGVPYTGLAWFGARRGRHRGQVNQQDDGLFCAMGHDGAAAKSCAEIGRMAAL